MTETLPRVWVTYAWKDNDEGDFDYVVQRLREAGVDARYDKIELVPGQRLWDQIAAHITDPATDGWAWLLTPASVESEACREELSYALDRALEERGSFPLVGLFHGVQPRDAPPAIKARLGVALSHPEWPQQVLAGLGRRAPDVQEQERVPIVAGIHPSFGGNIGAVLLEFRPRLEHVHSWRVAIPPDVVVLNFGAGPAGGVGPGQIQVMTADGPGAINGANVRIVGSGAELTPATSAYVVLQAEADGLLRPMQVFFVYRVGHAEHVVPFDIGRSTE